MKYTNKTKSNLIEILKYRDNEIKEFQSLYAHSDGNITSMKQQFKVLVYLLLLTFTIGVLF